MYDSLQTQQKCWILTTHTKRLSFDHSMTKCFIFVAGALKALSQLLMKTVHHIIEFFKNQVGPL